jgi:hypothetical protein
MESANPSAICSGHEKQSCLRKYRHPNFLSAVMHAREIDDGGLCIYGCEYCGGSHVGHAQRAAPAKPTLATKLRRNSSKLERAQHALRTNDGTMKPLTRRALMQSIRDLSKHRQMLEREAAKDFKEDAAPKAPSGLRGIAATLLISTGTALQHLGRAVSEGHKPPRPSTTCR